VKKRNRLLTSTISACVLSSQCVQNNGSTCRDFIATEDMLKSMTKRCLYGIPKQPSQQQSSNLCGDDGDADDDEDDPFTFDN